MNNSLFIFKLLFVIINACAGQTDDYSAHAHAAQKAIVTHAADQLVLNMLDEEPIEVHVKVKRPNLTPIEGASVTGTLVGNEAPAFSGSTDSNGDVNFAGITEGNYAILISASGYQTKADTVYIAHELSRVYVLAAE